MTHPHDIAPEHGGRGKRDAAPFYGPDLAAIHAADHEQLARAAAETLAARLSESARVLDLGCGAGALSAVLADRGHRVRGIDASSALIAMARVRRPELHFEEGDILTADLGRADAVAAIGEVVNYATATGGTRALTDLFARVRAALPEGGIFIFDGAGPDRHSDSPSVWSNTGESFVAMRARVEGGTLTREIVTFVREGGAWRRSEETHRLRLHDPARVVAALGAAGFAVCALPGYDGCSMPPGLHTFLAEAER